METMDYCMAEDECPVCKDIIRNPSEPSPCCRKVFCQSCLTRSIRERHHCPHCRTPMPACGGFTFRSGRIPLIHLAGLADDTFNAARPVGNNIQDVLNRFRQLPVPAVPANQVPVARTAQATLPSSALPPAGRPIPRPRVRSRARASVTAAPIVPVSNPFAINIQAAPAVPVAPPPALLNGPANPSPLIIPDSSSDELDEIAWRTEIALLENVLRQPLSPSVRTFHCPYCQQDGLDDLDLLDHCNANHLSDTRRVVCPVCVSLPHGNPLYHSRDFIGHLNLRHCYYIEDITNIHQSDEVNLQAAILMSLTQANQTAH
ncbi:hypothetical protein AOLI_G00031150 [Acnodon oligacanthus]